MRLLENSWSEMLILDQIHQRMHNHLPDETTLANGQKFELLSLGLLGVPSMSDAFTDLTNKLSNLKFDSADYVCLKFVLLLNPGKYLQRYCSLFLFEQCNNYSVTHFRCSNAKKSKPCTGLPRPSSTHIARILYQLLPERPGKSQIDSFVHWHGWSYKNLFIFRINSTSC